MAAAEVRLVDLLAQAIADVDAVPGELDPGALAAFTYKHSPSRPTYRPTEGSVLLGPSFTH